MPELRHAEKDGSGLKPKVNMEGVGVGSVSSGAKEPSDFCEPLDFKVHT